MAIQNERSYLVSVAERQFKVFWNLKVVFHFSIFRYLTPTRMQLLILELETNVLNFLDLTIINNWYTKSIDILTIIQTFLKLTLTNFRKETIQKTKNARVNN